MDKTMRHYLVEGPCGRYELANSEILKKGDYLRCKRVNPENGKEHFHGIAVVRKLRKVETVERT